MDEEQADEERDARDGQRDGSALLTQLGGQLNCEQTKQRGELDDRVHGDRRGILEWIADGIADDASCMQLGALLFELGLDDLLGVVPSAAGVGHKQGLEQTEQRDADQVADEEVRL